jgi:hypothetical protein
VDTSGVKPSKSTDEDSLTTANEDDSNSHFVAKVSYSFNDSFDLNLPGSNIHVSRTRPKIMEHSLETMMTISKLLSRKRWQSR